MTTKLGLATVRFSPTEPDGSPASSRPLLVLGPSLGTSVRALWAPAATLLAERFDVIGWDLPGHGAGPTPTSGFDQAELAGAVLELAGAALAERGEPGGTFGYAGVSFGGTVGLQLLLDHPGRISAAVVICSAARIGTPEIWQDRAALVRESGTEATVEGAIVRWFAPGFVEAQPDVASDLLQSLKDTDRSAYAWACDALAGFDVRDRLGEIAVPVLAVAGGQDQVTPPRSAYQLAAGVIAGRAAVIEGVAHLAPAEDPAGIARLITDFAGTGDRAGVAGRTGTPDGSGASKSLYDQGMKVRREVLGDTHVDRAVAGTTPFTAGFQDLITRYAWGEIWARPGLDRRSRSLITLTALVALGHHEELAMHVRAARTNGLSNDEIGELLLQTAIYCGVPAANSAFRIAQQVLAELDA
jgi:3-oxoadipate enol-lactonase/4-carboxymuconolactone decarboxylase